MKIEIAPRAIAPLIIGVTALAAAALINVFPEAADAQVQAQIHISLQAPTVRTSDGAVGA